MTTEQKLAQLGDDFARWAHGCSQREAAALLDEIQLSWNVPRSLLPDLVATLSAGSGMGPPAVVAWLWSTLRILDCESGRALCVELGTCAAREIARATEAETKH